MTQVVTLTLDQINCILEADNPSTPYLWTAFVSIDAAGNVGVLTPPEGDDRVVLAENLQPGQSAQIPSAVGVATQSVDDLAAFIQLTLLWQKHGTPGSVVRAGFNEFGPALQQAITANLLDLNSSDPQTVQAAIDAIQNTVHADVYKTMDNKLSAAEKVEIELGLLTLDGGPLQGRQVITDMRSQSQSFTMTLGDPSNGQLLFYRDETQNGTGNVAGPSTIGDSGWNVFKFLFSGGNGIIYAVKGGDLLFFRDHNQDGTGEVAHPSTIGHGGWDAYKFVFSGGNGIIYAVNKRGQLLFFRDHNQDGTGNVAHPSVIGKGAWTEFKFLFSGGNGTIYAVDKQGQLAFYLDHNQDGTGDVADPSVIGASGFDAYKFLFSGGNGIIYAAEVGPTHYYEIPLTFQITTSGPPEPRPR